MNHYTDRQAVGRRSLELRSTAFGVLILAALMVGCQTFSGPTDRPAAAPVAGVEASPTAVDPAARTAETPLPTAPPLPTDTPAPTAIPEATETVVPTAPPAPAVFPRPADYTWELVAGGFEQPLDLASANDGSGRLFVVEQPGVIRILEGGAPLPGAFLDIRDRVGFNASEQGLLGLAFHPRYAETGSFFVNYTDGAGDTVIARFQVSDDPNRAEPGSEVRLFRIGQPYRNHNGGGLAFGPDGYLYIALGDGGSAGDPQGYGQSLDTLLGKVLRVDVDHGEPYAAPPDNPFVEQPGLDEIWAWGLRNPWRISFDRMTGDLFIADVGQNVWEEVNFQPAGSTGGENYGWDYREGRHDYEGLAPADLALVEPVAEYNHSLGCSISGGHVYRGAALPEWQGIYFYGDYCQGNIWGLLRDSSGAWQAELLFQTDTRVASFGLDEAGELYLADYGGQILKLVVR